MLVKEAGETTAE